MTTVDEPTLWDDSPEPPRVVDQRKPNHLAGDEPKLAQRVSQRARKVFTAKPAEDKPPKLPKETPAYRKGVLVEPIANLYGLGGMLLAPFDPNCAQVLMLNAQACAEAWDELAKENEAVRRILHALVETSAWGKVAIAHAPILVGIAVHHSTGAQNFVQAMQDRQQNAAEAESDEYANPEYAEGDSVRWEPTPAPIPFPMNGTKRGRRVTSGE